MTFLRRLRFFLAVVLRPVTGPAGNEPPLSWLESLYRYRPTPAVAWELAGVVCGKKRGTRNA